MATWTCPACTLINAGDAAACEACSSLQPRAAPLVRSGSPCRGCQRPLGFGTSIQALGANYHPGCFRCAACHKVFDAGARFQAHENELYHAMCYKELFHPRCGLCSELLPMNTSGHIVYKEMTFWNLKYCAIHDQRDRCCSCKRPEPTASNRRFESLSDGRKVCSGCSETVILDTAEVQPVVAHVWSFLASLGMHLPDLPVLLVDFETLNAHTHDHHANLPREAKGPAVYGVCLSEVRYVRHIARRGAQERMQLSDRRVNAILILHGLPYDMTAYILAHEATHAYLKLRPEFPAHLPPKVEEGVCNLMGYLFLQYTTLVDPTEARSFRTSLRRFYSHQLLHDTSPVYGDGFREALAAYNTHNSLQQVLDRVRAAQL
ncbi:hypothetical protein ACHHYP_20824 [Achlya hypogyna]|uniref:LIM zinc-binding domain-containing protein n=1 Tax=Achlya hypogyna TaxID=1202772 RepID=A0A1V9ZDY1_ACHHY|nr:hypothetical protein ACHHYP_20824 [Achlya hypogyna]